MLVSVALLSVALARSPETCGSGESLLCMSASTCQIYTVCEKSELEKTVGAAPGLENALAQDLALIPEVSHIFVEGAEQNLLVWIALDNPITEVRERVFKKELELMEGFPEVDFDFNLVRSQGRTTQELVSGAKLLYSRAEN